MAIKLKTLRKRIIAEFRKFLILRYSTLNDLTLDDLDVNPFMVLMYSKAMRLNSPRSIVAFMISQRFERGSVTSMGNTLQSVAKLFSEGTGVEGADLMKRRKGKRYYFQVKSGPNNVNKDISISITQLLQSAIRRNPGSVPMFGMCYGTKERVSSMVKKYVKIDYLIGREFWEFISGDKQCIFKIYKLGAIAAKQVEKEKHISLIGALQKKTSKLTREFKEKYRSGTKLWGDLIRENS